MAFDDSNTMQAGSPIEGAASQPLLIPVSEEDFERPRRRRRFLIAAVAIVAISATAYFYKRSVDPIHGLEAFDAGERLLKTARYQQAIVSFDRAVALRPDLVDAYSLRGRAYIGLSKPDAAIADFTTVISMRPSDPEPYLDRASAHLDLKQYPETLADCERALKLDPKLDTAYNLRGIALRTIGETEKSLEAFNRAVELKADVSNLFQRGSTLQELNRHQEAIEDFTRVISFTPQSAQPYFARAKSYRAIGDTAAANTDHHTGRVLDGH